MPVNASRYPVARNTLRSKAWRIASDCFVRICPPDSSPRGSPRREVFSSPNSSHAAFPAAFRDGEKFPLPGSVISACAGRDVASTFATRSFQGTPMLILHDPACATYAVPGHVEAPFRVLRTAEHLLRAPSPVELCRAGHGRRDAGGRQAAAARPLRQAPRAVAQPQGRFRSRLPRHARDRPARAPRRVRRHPRRRTRARRRQGVFLDAPAGAPRHARQGDGLLLPELHRHRRAARPQGDGRGARGGVGFRRSPRQRHGGDPGAKKGFLYVSVHQSPGIRTRAWSRWATRAIIPWLPARRPKSTWRFWRRVGRK